MLHEQANTLDPYNIEAFLLKGTALLELKKVDDATPHMKEALRLAPHRYEAYTGKEALDWPHTGTRPTQVKPNGS